MYVRGASIFYGHSGAALGSYQKRYHRLSGKRLRQINRFAYMALIGGFELVDNRGLSSETGIYLTTINGNIADTDAAVCQLYRDGRLPMPYNFIHTMANTAAFYLSRELGIRGRNITLSAGTLSFERGLAAAASDLAIGRVKEALIGGIDEAGGDAALTAGSTDTAGGCDEGCTWLHVTVCREGTIGEIEDCSSFACRQKAMEWVGRSDARQPFGLLFANSVGPSERTAWRQIADTDSSLSAPRGKGAFFESSGCTIAAFFKQPAGTGTCGSAALINRDKAGRYVVTTLRRHGPGD